jgi:hypothetical protein
MACPVMEDWLSKRKFPPRRSPCFKWSWTQNPVTAVTVQCPKYSKTIMIQLGHKHSELKHLYRLLDQSTWWSCGFLHCVVSLVCSHHFGRKCCLDLQGDWITFMWTHHPECENKHKTVHSARIHNTITWVTPDMKPENLHIKNHVNIQRLSDFDLTEN